MFTFFLEEINIKLVSIVFKIKWPKSDEKQKFGVGGLFATILKGKFVATNWKSVPRSSETVVTPLGVNVYLGAIFSCPEVKVTQGHECQLLWTVSVVYFDRYNYNFTAGLSLGLLFRAKLIPHLESSPAN